MSPEEVAILTGAEREQRVLILIERAHELIASAIDEYVTRTGHELAGVVTLYSGGNDSTVLAHLMRQHSTHHGHANTGIGIERTRQFVRETSAAWGIPLLERCAPLEADSYRTLVLERGFPGPGQHFKMFQRLKERALREIRRLLVTNGRQQRVLFVAGRRRSESARRSTIVELERVDSVVWVSPLADWTKLDLNTYRLMAARRGDPVPVNEVTNLAHMSGECLCGAFAKRGELEELEYWFPDDIAAIRALEVELEHRHDIPAERRRWGWGAYRDDPPSPSSTTGRLCSSCEVARG